MPDCRISNWQVSVSGQWNVFAIDLGSVYAQAAAALRVRHDERADRAVITAAPEAYMAMVVLTRLHLLTPEQVAGRDVEPARARVHQLIAGDREAIHLPQQVSGLGMRQCWNGGNQRRDNEQCQSHQRNSLSMQPHRRATAGLRCAGKRLAPLPCGHSVRRMSRSLWRQPKMMKERKSSSWRLLL
jgi:hypothetical protein